VKKDKKEKRRRRRRRRRRRKTSFQAVFPYLRNVSRNLLMKL